MKSATFNSIATASALALNVLFPNEPALAQGCRTPSFAAAPMASDAGGTPVHVAAGDFNGDGRADLAVVNYESIVHALGGSNDNGGLGSSILQVLVGKGDGTFQAPVSYVAGGTPVSVAVGDFNGDGKLDLGVANYSLYDDTNAFKISINGNVSVLLGNGDSSFQPAVKSRAGAILLSLAVNDFNGDGKADLAGANYGFYDRSSGTYTNSGVSVLVGKGDGTFEPAVNYGAGRLPCSVSVGDFNGDGKPDLAVANSGSYPSFADGGVSVLLGGGDGSFHPAVNYGAGEIPLSIAVGDFNGDDKPDVAVANGGSYGNGFFTGAGVSVLSGKGDGTFHAPVGYDAGTGTYSLAVGDFDGNGRSDLAVVNAQRSGAVSVLLAKGDGTFLPPSRYGVRRQPSSLAVGDFNGDGKSDLAVANWLDRCVSVLPGNGNGTFQAVINYYGGPGPRCVAAGDFNGDGALDLGVATAAGFWALLGNGDGTFRAPVNQGERWVGYRSVVVSDFNGDGKVDVALLMSAYHGSVSLLSGKGDGTFLAAASYDTGSYPWAMAVGDFNGDDKPDLAVANTAAYDQTSPYLKSGVTVLLNKGDGTFRTADNHLEGTDSRSVAVADFNGDGKSDLAVANYDSVSVLLGTGDGTFEPASNHAAELALYTLAAGDFNGDGKPDVAVGHSGGLSVLLNKGDATFHAPVNYLPAGVFIAVGDFNGDDKLDLAVADYGLYNWAVVSAGLSILLGNGNGTFRAAVAYSVGTLPKSVAPGDFNGDGKPDLAVANSYSDDISVLLNTCVAANSIPDALSQALSVNEDMALPITLFAFDVDPDVLTYTLASPAHGILSGTAPDVIYQPPTNYFGPDRFTFSVNDGKTNSAPATISIAVSPVNDPPVADSSATVTRLISSNNRDARGLLNGSRSHDVDNDLLQFSWSVDRATTPSATGRVAVVTLSTGSHDILLRVADGQTAGTDRITVVVLTAAQAVHELAAHVRAAQLRHAQSLLSQLSVAGRAFDRGNSDSGTHHLELFKNRLRELTERNGIDPATAAALLRDAQTIIAAVSDTQNPQPQFMTCKCEKGGHVRMLFTGAAARTYVIEASSDLKTWSPVGIGKERAEGEFEFEEAGTGLPACRFYRIVAP